MREKNHTIGSMEVEILLFHDFDSHRSILTIVWRSLAHGEETFWIWIVLSYNGFFDVFRIHPHINKSCNNQRIATYIIVHFAILSYNPGTIDVLTLYWFGMATQRKFHQHSNNLLGFVYKIFSCANAKFRDQIVANDLKLLSGSFLENKSMKHTGVNALEYF